MPNTYDTTLGALLVATWVNTMLYTLEISQVCVYFKHHCQKDPVLVRTMVIVCLSFDSAGIIAECACVYLYTVKYWGHADYLLNQYWPIPMYVMTTAVTSLVVQMFLIRRYFHLVRSSDGPWKSICMVILSVTSFGGACTVAIMISLHSAYESRRLLVVPVMLYLCLTAVTDWSIALSLIHKLRQMRSGFKTSAGTLKRLTYMAIQTGMATSVLALVGFSLYLAAGNTTDLGTAFSFCIGTTYSLSMLHNLNRRQVLAGRTAATPSCSEETGSLGVGISALLPSPTNHPGADPIPIPKDRHQG